MADLLRLFIALPIPASQRQALAALARRLPPPAPQTRLAFCSADTLHLTLAFLGDTDASALPALKEGLSILAASLSGFPLLPTRLGGFPDAEKAKIVWLGYAQSHELEALAAGVGRVVDGLGLARDAKPFKAHLTLARVKGGALSCKDVLALTTQETASLGFRAERFTLFRSRLGPGGARHESLAEFPLRGAPGESLA